MPSGEDPFMFLGETFEERYPVHAAKQRELKQAAASAASAASLMPTPAEREQERLRKQQQLLAQMSDLQLLRHRMGEAYDQSGGGWNINRTTTQDRSQVGLQGGNNAQTQMAAWQSDPNDPNFQGKLHLQSRSQQAGTGLDPVNVSHASTWDTRKRASFPGLPGGFLLGTPYWSQDKK